MKKHLSAVTSVMCQVCLTNLINGHKWIWVWVWVWVVITGQKIPVSLHLQALRENVTTKLGDWCELPCVEFQFPLAINIQHLWHKFVHKTCHYKPFVCLTFHSNCRRRKKCHERKDLENKWEAKIYKYFWLFFKNIFSLVSVYCSLLVGS